VKGIVDEDGRALLPLTVRATEDEAPHQIVAWVDTAFDGELVVPLQEIQRLGLPEAAAV